MLHRFEPCPKRNEDPWTLGAMSEDAWKELRLPLGLKESLGMEGIREPVSRVIMS